MASMSSYFINDRIQAVANTSSVVKGAKFRFSILTDRLVRLEYSPSGVFEDRPSQLVIRRNFEPVKFDVSESETLIEIKTKYFTLTYVKNKPLAGSKVIVGNTLKVLLNDSAKEWYYGNPEVRNFGGVNYSLDNFMGNLKLNNGLYSADGFTAIDDSKSLVLGNNDEYVERENNSSDIYLFVYRRDFGMCLRDYYELTGFPAFIPRYALGNWWYKNEAYSTGDVKDVVNKFNDNNIPLSVFLLGNKWHDDVNHYRFNPNLFQGNELQTFLKSKNIKLGLTVNPETGITNGDVMFNEAAKYINPSGKKIEFLPFNMTKMAIYFNLFIKPLQVEGVNFFNIDYNNPKDLRNLWLLNHYHSVEMPLLMGQRGLIMSRNSLMAAHRYPVCFTGKTKVNWETLNILPFYNSSASNMGISFNAHAIGGFSGGIEDSELYMRYIQLGTFSPIFLLASDGGKYYKREPWRWSQANMGIIRQYMQLRHKIIPYIYSEAYVYHKTGAPLIQPFYYLYPKIYDEPLYKNQYFFGSEMFVAPITKKKNPVMNRVVQRIFVPDGVWYDYITGKKYPGNKYYMSFYKDDEYPVFCKEGSIIPLSLDEGTDVPVNMEVNVFPGANSVYNLYEDDGITDNYKNGDYVITNFEFQYQKDNYTLIIKPLEGRDSFFGKLRNYKVRFRNMKECFVNVTVNGVSVTPKTYTDKNDFVIEVDGVGLNGNVVVNCRGNDIMIEAVSLINEDIANILDDLEIETTLKEKADAILFSDMSIKKKRIEIRKLRRYRLEPKFVKLFINLLEYIEQV